MPAMYNKFYSTFEAANDGFFISMWSECTHRLYLESDPAELCQVDLAVKQYCRH